MNPQEDESTLVAHLEYFSDRLLRVFSHSFFTIEFQNDKDLHHPESIKDCRPLMLHVIRDACLNETLIALRDIDDFLVPRECSSRSEKGRTKARASDLLASDFGYLENKTFLSTSERTDINQMIAHTTKRGPEGYQQNWDVWEMVSKCVSQCSSFLDWVEQQHKSHFLLFTAALNCRFTTRKIYEAVHAARDDKQTSQV